jgi:glutamate formiminotransferase
MKDIVEMARGLGDEIAHNLKIPVYFYGYAALRHDRQELPAVRRGGYKRLKEEIGSAIRHPDYGESVLHPRGGAMAVGVRDFLIAFNVNLSSNDLDAARHIAKLTRETHGGLPGVRAIGVSLKSRGIVQVSINVIDHRETTLREVMDFVSRKAGEMGIGIKEGELIGLVPRDAIFPNMKAYLKLPNFDGKKVLNNYL